MTSTWEPSSLSRPKRTHQLTWILLASPLCLGARPASAETLFVSRVVTEPGLFTKGIEGPAWSPSGDLLVVNFKKPGTIGRVDANGKVSLFLELPSGSVSSGLRFGAMGDLWIADYKAHTIYRLKQGEAKPSVFVREPRMSQPNDLVLMRDGSIWATDPNWKKRSGRIWRISPDGKAEIAVDKLGTVNGIDLSPDEKLLYVSDSNGRSVWSFAISGEKLKSRKLVKRFNDASVDGLKTDREGNIYVARIEKGQIAKLSPSGQVLKEIRLIGKNPTNLAFGGADGRTVYVTQMDGGTVEAFRVDVPGRESLNQAKSERQEEEK